MFGSHKGPQTVNIIVIEEEIIEIEGQRFHKHHHHHHHDHHRFIALFSIIDNNNKFLLMDSLSIGLGKTRTIGIEIFDTVTGLVIDAPKSGQTYSVDSAAVTAAPNAADAGNEDLTGAAVGTANLSGTVVADLSAFGGAAGTTLTPATIPVTVTAAPVVAGARFVDLTPA